MYPHERSLVKKMESKPFALVGINSDEDREKLKEVLVKQEITWRSFWNGGGTSGPIASAWNVHGWPTLYLLDHQGIIRHKYHGSPGDEVIDRHIENLIAEAEKEQMGGK